MLKINNISDWLEKGDLWSESLKLTTPILLAFFPLGLAFGFIATDQGIPWFYVFLMSFLIYAGSSEFLAASMMSVRDPLLQILLAGFLINLRHAFYGLSVMNNIPSKGIQRLYIIATLSDETYALIASLKPGERTESLSVRIAVLNHFYWFGSVLLGAIAGSVYTVPFKGLEYCLTALFTVLLIEQWYSLKNFLPFVLAVGAAVLALLINPHHMILIALMVSTLALTLVMKLNLNLVTKE